MRAASGFPCVARFLLPSRYDADAPMSRATFNRVTYAVVEQAKKEGVADLRMSGLKKVKDGVTSLEEINRVTIE